MMVQKTYCYICLVLTVLLGHTALVGMGTKASKLGGTLKKIGTKLQPTSFKPSDFAGFKDMQIFKDRAKKNEVSFPKTSKQQELWFKEMGKQFDTDYFSYLLEKLPENQERYLVELQNQIDLLLKADKNTITDPVALKLREQFETFLVQEQKSSVEEKKLEEAKPFLFEEKPVSSVKKIEGQELVKEFKPIISTSPTFQLLQANLQQTKKANLELQEKVELLIKDLALGKNTIQEYEKNITQLTTQLTNSQQELAKIKGQLGEFVTDNASLKNQVSQQQGEILSLMGQLDSLKNELQQKQEVSKRQLSMQEQEFVREIQSKSEGELVAKEEEIDRLSQKIEELNQLLQNNEKQKNLVSQQLQQEVDALIKEMGIKEKLVTDLKASLLTTEKDFKQVSQQDKEVARKLQNENAQLAQELQKAVQATKELQKNSDVIKSNLFTTVEEYRRTETELKNLKDYFAQQIELLTQQNAELKNDVQKKEQAAQELKESQDKGQNELRQYQASLEQLKREYLQVQTSLDTANSQKEELQQIYQLSLADVLQQEQVKIEQLEVAKNQVDFSLQQALDSLGQQAQELAEFKQVYNQLEAKNVNVEKQLLEVSQANELLAQDLKNQLLVLNESSALKESQMRENLRKYQEFTEQQEQRSQKEFNLIKSSLEQKNNELVEQIKNSENQIRSLQNKLVELGQEKNTILASLQDMQQKAQQDAVQYQQQLEMVSNDVVLLQNNVAQQKQEYEQRLQQERLNAGQQEAQFKQQLQERSDKEKALEEQLAQLQVQVQNATKALEKVQQEKIDAEIALKNEAQVRLDKALEQQKDEATRLINELQQDKQKNIESLTSQLKEVLEQRDTAAANLQGLQERNNMQVEQLQQQLTILQNNAVQQKQEYEQRLQQEGANASQQEAQFKQQLQERINQEMSLQKQLTQLQQQVQVANQTLEKVQQEKIDAESALKNEAQLRLEQVLKQQQEQLAQVVDQVRQDEKIKLDNLNLQLQETLAQRDTLATRMASLQERMTTVLLQLEEFQQANKDLNERLLTAEQNNQNYVQQIEQLNLSITQDKQALQIQHAQEIADIRDLLSLAEQKNNEQSEQLKVMQKQLDDNKEVVQNYDQRISQLRVAEKDSALKLAQEQELVNQLNQQLEKVGQQLTGLETDAQNLKAAHKDELTNIKSEYELKIQNLMQQMQVVTANLQELERNAQENESERERFKQVAQKDTVELLQKHAQEILALEDKLNKALKRIAELDLLLAKNEGAAKEAVAQVEQQVKKMDEQIVVIEAEKNKALGNVQQVDVRAQQAENKAALLEQQLYEIKESFGQQALLKDLIVNKEQQQGKLLSEIILERDAVKEENMQLKQALAATTEQTAITLQNTVAELNKKFDQKLAQIAQESQERLLKEVAAQKERDEKLIAQEREKALQAQELLKQQEQQLRQLAAVNKDSVTQLQQKDLAVELTNQKIQQLEEKIVKQQADFDGLMKKLMDAQLEAQQALEVEKNKVAVLVEQQTKQYDAKLKELRQNFELVENEAGKEIKRLKYSNELERQKYQKDIEVMKVQSQELLNVKEAEKARVQEVQQELARKDELVRRTKVELEVREKDLDLLHDKYEKQIKELSDKATDEIKAREGALEKLEREIQQLKKDYIKERDAVRSKFDLEQKKLKNELQKRDNQITQLKAEKESGRRIELPNDQKRIGDQKSITSGNVSRPMTFGPGFIPVSVPEQGQGIGGGAITPQPTQDEQTVVPQESLSRPTVPLVVSPQQGLQVPQNVSSQSSGQVVPMSSTTSGAPGMQSVGSSMQPGGGQTGYKPSSSVGAKENAKSGASGMPGTVGQPIMQAPKTSPTPNGLQRPFFGGSTAGRTQPQMGPQPIDIKLLEEKKREIEAPELGKDKPVQTKRNRVRTLAQKISK